MKKKLLAISVATALGVAAGSASAFTAVEGGVGLYNVLPYYSVQEGNATLIHITNTDTQNGKAVKVRFRGAEWSDDVFDFQVFLSPGDVWAGAVTASGDLAKLNTTDESCTLPVKEELDGHEFVAGRLFGDAGDAGVREGYVEILTMANIEYEQPGRVHESNSALANAIKHPSSGVPSCEGLESLEENSFWRAAEEETLAADMSAPTGSLISFATIINVPTSKSFTTAGVALVPGEAPATPMYFMQSNDEYETQDADVVTSDRIFYETGAAGLGMKLYHFDLPDLTTSLSGGAPDDQLELVQAALETASVNVEYVTDESIDASTDVVITQPVRRFFYDYDTTGDTYEVVYGDFEAEFDIEGRAATVYADLNGETNRVNVEAATFFDREEQTPTNPSSIVISPNPPSAAARFSLKGEVSVLSFNNNGNDVTGSLNASLTINDYTTPYADGWANLSTTSRGTDGGALPVIGFNAIKVFNNSVQDGTNYGMTLPLRKVAP